MYVYLTVQTEHKEMKTRGALQTCSSDQSHHLTCSSDQSYHLTSLATPTTLPHSANWTQRDENKRRPTNMLLRQIISSDITSHAHYSAMVNQQLTADCDHTQHIPEPCACLSFFHVSTFSQSTSVQLHLIPHHLLSATSCRRHSAPMMLNLYIITAYTCL